MGKLKNLNYLKPILKYSLSIESWFSLLDRIVTVGRSSQL